MKKDWASQGGCAEDEALGQLDVEDGMIHGPGGLGCGDNKRGFCGVFTVDLGGNRKKYRSSFVMCTKKKMRYWDNELYF